jgi:hypothetical protein
MLAYTGKSLVLMTRPEVGYALQKDTDGITEAISTPGPRALPPGNTSSVRSCEPFVTFVDEYRYPLLGSRTSPFFNSKGILTVQVANWGLPLAAIADIRKDPEMISGTMSTTLAAYSYVYGSW